MSEIDDLHHAEDDQKTGGDRIKDGRGSDDVERVRSRRSPRELRAAERGCACAARHVYRDGTAQGHASSAAKRAAAPATPRCARVPEMVARSPYFNFGHCSPGSTFLNYSRIFTVPSFLLVQDTS